MAWERIRISDVFLSTSTGFTVHFNYTSFDLHFQVLFDVFISFTVSFTPHYYSYYLLTIPPFT